MKLEWPWKAKKITLEKDLQMLEKRLDSVLKPVEPRAAFTNRLRNQLVGKPKRKNARINWQSPQLRTGLLVAGGLVAMLITSIRVIGAIIGMRQLVVENKKPIQA